MSNAFEEYAKYFDDLPFHGKLEEIKKIESLSGNVYLSTKTSALHFDGYLSANDSIAVKEDNGEHYVYLWKHAWGEPFYVGSGVRDRWKTKASRCDDFYRNLDAGDAVVYKILDGVDSKTARLYESYVSTNISIAGYCLANGDNNAVRGSERTQYRLLLKCKEIENEELTKRVEKAVFDILHHEAKCDYRITIEFLKQYGGDYFSRSFSSVAV